MADEVWILGGAGRSGRATAVTLAAAGVPVVLVGRDAARLQDAAARVVAARTVVADSVEAMIVEIRRQQPAVVVNTVGPFAATAAPVARACLPSSSYVDLGNDFLAVSALLGLHEQAVAAGRALVTGAGFGVLATESVVVRLCQGRPPAERVRTDAVPSVALEAGVLGESLAATIVDGVPEGGRRYAHGRLVRAQVGGDIAHLTLPDGSRVHHRERPAGRARRGAAGKRRAVRGLGVERSAELNCGACDPAARVGPAVARSAAHPGPAPARPRAVRGPAAPPRTLLGTRKRAVGRRHQQVGLAADR